MPDALRLVLAIAAKDIRAELRSRTALLSAVVFAALVLVIFNFARDPTAVAALDLAPGVLWVTFALAAMVALNRAFTVERENGLILGTANVVPRPVRLSTSMVPPWASTMTRTMWSPRPSPP